MLHENSFVAIDFETATTRFFSACSLGIVVVENCEIIKKEYYLIQPPENFYEDENIKIHGISSNDTANADTFDVIWGKIAQYFDGSYYVVAHNAHFDMTVLKSALEYYSLTAANFTYFCSIPVSGLNIDYEKWREKSLAARCEHYGITLNEHHNALCDAEACAKLVIYALQNNNRYKTVKTFLTMRVNCKNFDDVVLKSRGMFGGHNRVAIKEVAATVDNVVIDADFYNKAFCFTGELIRLTRAQAYAKVIAGGGRVVSGVTSKTDVLVNAEDKLSNKLKAARALQEQGHKIKIVSDDQFMQMLEDLEAVDI